MIHDEEEQVTMGDEFDASAMVRTDEAMRRHTTAGGVPGVAWLVSTPSATHVGAAGVADSAAAPMQVDAIFRIASMTKPITAVAALQLVDDGTIALDDAVDPWLPELADRRVLAPGATSIDDTVPAARPITLRDLLTLRWGLGYDFSGTTEQLSLQALAGAGLQLGPPEPATMPSGDELMALLGSVPLEHQPGERWLYHFGSEVLGVLVERITGQRLADVMAERIFAPLGMVDTGFTVTASSMPRFGSCFGHDHETDERVEWDRRDGRWTGPLAFHSGGGGLVSTLADFHVFARMLLAGGSHPTDPSVRIVSADAVAAMTTDQLTEQQRATGPSADGSEGWGFGLGVQVGADDPARPVGSYGWTGGLGTVWVTDPARSVVAIVLTNEMFRSPVLPDVCADFLRLALGAG